ncbi:MAG: hypothetical protein PHV48_05365, partial [Candidatus Omnitrophica bacterium]|nr:hypothetical protein [Candidatus Omnitrophota bacterium]
FDEEFRFAALEDIELGYRLETKGLRIVFDKSTVGYHCHEITFDYFCKRMKRVGVSADILTRKHPELRKTLVPLPIGLLTVIHNVIKPLRPLNRIDNRFLWDLYLAASYIDGLLTRSDSSVL